jgi:hypothetical protein
MTHLPEEPWRADGAPPRQARTNGLTAATWTPLRDIEPGLTAAVLDALRHASVPAYAAPVTGRTGAYLEVRLPRTPTDRLWVDATLVTEASDVLDSTLPGLQADLVDDFEAIVANFDRTSDVSVPPWPVDEDVDPAHEPTYEPAPAVAAPTFSFDDEHFVPPDPPPSPPLHPVAKYGWVALITGVLALIIPTLFGRMLSTGWTLLAIACIVGGFATLVFRMKDAPPTDSGPDDGAVV